MTTKPPITCHVLNTVTGQPAASLPVTLSLITPSTLGVKATFTSTTNSDGRVLSWDAPVDAAHPDLAEVFAAGQEWALRGGTDATLNDAQLEAEKSVVEVVSQALGGSPKATEDTVRGTAQKTVSMVWALKFDVGEYFKGEGFWTEVEVRFKTDIGGGEDGTASRSHWHVPLLLSPWSYTTYRGS